MNANNDTWFLVEDMASRDGRRRVVLQGKQTVGRFLARPEGGFARYVYREERDEKADRRRMGEWLENTSLGNPGLYCADIYPLDAPPGSWK